MRRQCSKGSACVNAMGSMCIGSVEESTCHLLPYLKRLGWDGICEVRNRPLFVLDVRNGTRHYIQLVPPEGSFRLLGIQLSPSLSWTNAITGLDAKVRKLQNMLDGAVRRRQWRQKDILTAESGKIMGLLRWHGAVVPIPEGKSCLWESRQGQTMLRQMNFDDEDDDDAFDCEVEASGLCDAGNPIGRGLV